MRAQRYVQWGGSCADLWLGAASLCVLTVSGTSVCGRRRSLSGPSTPPSQINNWVSISSQSDQPCHLTAFPSFCHRYVSFLLLTPFDRFLQSAVTCQIAIFYTWRRVFTSTPDRRFGYTCKLNANLHSCFLITLSRQHQPYSLIMVVFLYNSIGLYILILLIQTITIQCYVNVLIATSYYRDKCGRSVKLTIYSSIM
jgi:hypothetical protein